MNTIEWLLLLRTPVKQWISLTKKILGNIKKWHEKFNFVPLFC